jgi:hypothetical protein
MRSLLRFVHRDSGLRHGGVPRDGHGIESIRLSAPSDGANIPVKR